MRTLIAIFIAAALPVSSIGAELLWTFKSTQPVKAVSVLNEGRELAVLRSADVSVLSAETGKVVSSLANVSADTRAMVCNSATCWVGGGRHENGYLGVIDVQRRELKEAAVSEEFATIDAIALGTDGRLATGHADESVILWDSRSLKLRRRLVVQGGLEIYAVRFFGDVLAIGNDRGDLVLWDGESAAPSKRVNLGNGAILSIAVTRDRLFAGGWEYLDSIDPVRISQMRRIRFNGTSVLSCDAAVDDQELWCGLSDGSMSRIRTNDFRASPPEKLHRDEIRSVKVLGKAVITASKDGTVRAWRRMSQPARQKK